MAPHNTPFLPVYLGVEEAKDMILTATLSSEYSCHSQGSSPVVSFRLVSEEKVMSVHWGTLYWTPEQGDFAAVDTWGHSTEIEPRQWVGERGYRVHGEVLPERITFLVFALQGGTSG